MLWQICHHSKGLLQMKIHNNQNVFCKVIVYCILFGSKITLLSAFTRTTQTIHGNFKLFKLLVFKMFQLNYLFLAECELVGTACSGSFQQFLALYTARENKQNKSKNNTIPGNAHQQESKTQIFIMLNKCYPTE